MSQDDTDKILCYKMYRPSVSSAWLLLGTENDLKHIMYYLREEIDGDICNKVDLPDRELRIVAEYLTQEEIDKLPEFGGW